MRYWFLFCLIAIPLLMRSATPASSRWWRMGRSAIAFGLGYGVTVIWIYIDYLYFHTVVSSRSGAHWFMMGWLWTLTYMGWWELRWRFRYRKSLISLRKGMGDDWINNKVLYACIPGTLLVLLILGMIIVMELQFQGIIAS